MRGRSENFNFPESVALLRGGRGNFLGRDWYPLDTVVEEGVAQWWGRVSQVEKEAYFNIHLSCKKVYTT